MSAGARRTRYFNSAFTTVADALKTGRCTLVPNAMVYKVLTDPQSGKATGVLYIDRSTREPKEVRARAVVLCAQALESTRILFNSANKDHEAGLANSSGALGHYLMDHHSSAGAFGLLADLNAPVKIGPPDRPNGIYVIRFRNTTTSPQQKDFIRGYGFQGGGGGGYPNFWAPGFGDAWKKAVLAPHPSYIQLGGFGETLARFENHATIDPEGKVDAWGIPVLHVNMTFGDNERAMMKDIAATAAEMIEAAGGTNVQSNADPNPVPGYGIHEVGTARMGNDPKTSVLNGFCQTHDVKNLFVMDGSCFVSIACQNPTLTIMALAVRSTDYLLEQMKSGTI